MGIRRRKVLQRGTTSIDSFIYERFDRARDAISREKEIKSWRREKKNDLVRRLNPKWEDLGEKLFGARRRDPSPSARARDDVCLTVR
jgi:hypothetical protein